MKSMAPEMSVRLLRGLALHDLVEHFQDELPPLLGADEALDPVGEDAHAHAVVVDLGEVQEERGHLEDEVALALPAAELRASRTCRSCSTTESSRSSMYSFTKRWLIRADTFQSMLRTSSPYWYSRTQSKERPVPLEGRVVLAHEEGVELPARLEPYLL